MWESDVINLPFALELPIVVVPIPFKLTFKTGFAFQPTFTSKVTVAQSSYYMLTQANFIATGATTMVQCEKRELNVLVIVGYTPGLLGKLKLKPQSKTILTQNYSEVRPPNITLCKG